MGVIIIQYITAHMAEALTLVELLEFHLQYFSLLLLLFVSPLAIKMACKFKEAADMYNKQFISQVLSQRPQLQLLSNMIQDT